MSHLNYNFNICTISFDENNNTRYHQLLHQAYVTPYHSIHSCISCIRASSHGCLKMNRWWKELNPWPQRGNRFSTAKLRHEPFLSHQLKPSGGWSWADLGDPSLNLVFFVNILNLLGIESPIKHLISYWLHFVAGKLFKNFSNTIYSTSWFSTGWSATSRPPITTRSSPSRRRSCARSAASPTFMKGVSPLQEL